MYMGVVNQRATPGMQDADHTYLAADETGILSQFLGSGCRNTEKEIVENRFC